MSYEHNRPQLKAFSLQFYIMISIPNHVINVYEIQYSTWIYGDYRQVE